MPLYFRKRRPLGQRAQFILAITALALVLALLLGWLFMRHQLSREPQGPESSAPSESAPPTYTEADTTQLLVILTDTGAEQFWLVQAAPMNKKMHIASIPAKTTTPAGLTLAEALHKHGPATATSHVATLTGLSVRSHMALSSADAETFLNDLEGGLSYTLPEAVQFTEQNEATVRLPAGPRTLTAAQTAGLLRYTHWTKNETQQTAGADLLSAILNQYLSPDRGLHGDFSTLSNLCQTNLRIHDYNAYKDTLDYLAASNTGDICDTVTLPGKYDKAGNFTIDAAALKKSSLYR